MAKPPDISNERNPQALSPRQVAHLLGVSASFVYSEIKARRLPHVRIGERRLVVEIAELEEFLRLRRVDAGAAADQWIRDRT